MRASLPLVRVHGGVRALVPMLSPDIPRDSPWSARERANDATRYYRRGTARFSIARARWERSGKWSHSGRGRTRLAWAIRLISAEEERFLSTTIVINCSN